MIVGVLKEIKNQENRVGLVPSGVRTLVEAGGTVLIERQAGVGSGISDTEYKKVGAQIISSAGEVWKRSKVIVKVKEPLPEEYSRFQEDQVIFTFLHLAVAPQLAKALIGKKVTGISYDTIQRPNGSLPLLKPMSEIAGKMAIHTGATYLQRNHGGKGVLLGGVPGIRHGKVTIIGGGAAGASACKVAVGMGADVTVIDVNVDRLQYLDDIFQGRITTLKSNSSNIEESVVQSDLVVGAVLVTGSKTPKLVTKEMVSRMAKGSVIVDVAIDQGGCVETCKPTTHEKPTYEVNGVIHYCVTNMPGAVSNTSTYALTNASLPYAKKFVEIGVEEAVLADPDLALGVNTYKGQVTHPAVANELGYTYVPIQSLLRKPGNGSGKKSSDPKKTNGKRSATRKVDVR